MNVGVVGAGTMGAGIAQVCLVAGHAVRLSDASPTALADGRQQVAAGLERLAAKGALDPTAHMDALARLTIAADTFDAAVGADAVIEAATEDLAVKRAVFAALSAAAPPGALLATNTSSLLVSAIAEAAARPEQVVGLHFLNPAPLMRLVEVVAGDRTAARVIETAVDFATGLGKDAVVCADAPGFIVNRVARPFTLEALRMLEAEEAGIIDIDRAMVAGGYPMGPFALLDLVGLDVSQTVTRNLYEAYDMPERLRPSELQARLVAAGRLGRKTRYGFYDYDDLGGMLGPGADATAAGPTLVDGAAIGDAEIRERIELAIINEAYRAAGEGVASPPDIDLALVLGAGHPVGPFVRARAIGLGHVVAGLRALEARHGERFRVAQTLWQVASI